MKCKHELCHTKGSLLGFSAQAGNLGKEKYKISGKNQDIKVINFISIKKNFKL